MFGLAPKYLSWLWQGFLLTLGLAAASAVAATAGGLLLAVMRHARGMAPRTVAAAYVVTFRNTPLLVQLLFWYFGVASLLPDTWIAWLNARHALNVGPFTLAWPSFEFVAGWVGLSAYTAAFVAEECEAGLRGVRRAQHDAAAALGLTPMQSLRYVVLPQAVRIALPQLFGQYMNLVKNRVVVCVAAGRDGDVQDVRRIRRGDCAVRRGGGRDRSRRVCGHAMARSAGSGALTMDLSLLFANLPYLLIGAFPDGPLGGAALSLLLAIASAAASAVLGIVLGVAMALARGPARVLLLAFIGFFRAIPVLMLIFWTYFLMPVLLHMDVPGLATVVCALALIGGAYLAHAVHAGIVAAGDGQWQAGLSLGLTRWQTVRYVLLPQAIRIMTPSFVNQWVALVKDTSLAYIVGVPELSFVATQVNNRLMVYPAPIFLFVALIYLVLCTSLDGAARWLLSRRPRAERIAQVAAEYTEPAR
jgi:polar amino acid transport system permease protein